MRLKPFVIWLFRSHWHFFYTQLSSDSFSSHRTYEVSESESENRSVVSDSLRPMDYTVHGIPQARILQWESLFLLQGIFPTQGSNPGLPHCRWILYQLSHQGSPLFYKCWQMHRIVSLWLPQSGLCSLTYPHPLVLSLGSQTFPPPF